MVRGEVGGEGVQVQGPILQGLWGREGGGSPGRAVSRVWVS